MLLLQQWQQTAMPRQAELQEVLCHTGHHLQQQRLALLVCRPLLQLLAAQLGQQVEAASLRLQLQQGKARQQQLHRHLQLLPALGLLQPRLSLLLRVLLLRHHSPQLQLLSTAQRQQPLQHQLLLHRRLRQLPLLATVGRMRACASAAMLRQHPLAAATRAPLLLLPQQIRETCV